MIPIYRGFDPEPVAWVPEPGDAEAAQYRMHIDVVDGRVVLRAERADGATTTLSLTPAAATELSLHLNTAVRYIEGRG